MQASQRLDRFGAEVFASLNNKLLALKAQGQDHLQHERGHARL